MPREKPTAPLLLAPLGHVSGSPRCARLLHVVFELLEIDVNQLPQLGKLLPELLCGDVVRIDMRLRRLDRRKTLLIFDLVNAVIDGGRRVLLATAQNLIPAESTHDVAESVLDIVRTRDKCGHVARSVTQGLLDRREALLHVIAGLDGSGKRAIKMRDLLLELLQRHAVDTGAKKVHRSWDRLLNSKDPTQAEGLYAGSEIGGDNVAEVRAPDPLTVQVVLKAPDRSELANLAHVSAGVVSDAAIDKLGKQVGTQLVGPQSKSAGPSGVSSR